MKQLNWYQIFGKSNIPDGKTVEPTDDIQIWLNCANIWDKTYTTLAEVLADTDTLLALISSKNAVDYMVRSTTWTVSSALVPKMTSNTTPSGVCFGSGVESGDYYLSFDGNDGSTPYLNPRSPSKSYVGYMFNEAVAISKVHLQTRSDKIGHHKIQGSEDGLTWEDLTADTATNSSNYIIDFDIDYAKKYKYIRDYGGCDSSNYANFVYTLQFYSPSVPTNATAMTYIGQNNYCANTLLADATWREAICNSEYFENVLNVKVPTMTSNTTPSGVCAASTYQSSYPAWKAFDGSESTAWGASTTSFPQYVTYTFPDSVHIFMATAITTRVATLKIQALDDGTWIDLSDTQSMTDAVKKTIILNSNNGLYQGYKALFVTGNSAGNGAYAREVQFYGREDV